MYRVSTYIKKEGRRNGAQKQKAHLAHTRPRLSLHIITQTNKSRFQSNNSIFNLKDINKEVQVKPPGNR